MEISDLDISPVDLPVDPLADSDDPPHGELSESDSLWNECVLGCEINEGQEVILSSCFHAICSESCWNVIFNEIKPGLQTTCPKCDSFIHRQDFETKFVPSNVLRRFNNADAVVSRSCENCVLDRPANAYCVDCVSFLCTNCEEIHPVTRSTQSHEIVQNFDSVNLLNKKKRDVMCKTHGLPRTSQFCSTCRIKLCKTCQVNQDHKNHDTFDLDKERENLMQKTDWTRDFVDTCDDTLTELKKKRDEIIKSDWERINSEINNEFAHMQQVLIKRLHELRKEVRNQFLKHVVSLNVKTKCAEACKVHGERFLNVLNKLEVDDDDDDIQRLSFLRLSKRNVEWYIGVYDQLTTHVDRYLERGFSFQVDKSAKFQTQKCLKEFCQVEYTRNPNSRVPVKTYAAVKKPSTGNDIVPTKSVSIRPVDEIQVADKLSEIVAKNVISPPKRFTVTNPGFRLPLNKKHVSEDFKQTIKSKIEERTNTSVLNELNMLEIDEVDPNNDNSFNSTDSNANENSEESYMEEQVQKMNVKSDGGTEIPVDANMDDDSPTKRPLKKAKKNNVKELIGRRQSVGNKMRASEMLETETKLDTTRGDPKRESLSSAMISDFGKRPLGKRERKKKSFPEFMDTDQSLKLLRKQNAMIKKASPVSKMPRIEKVYKETDQMPTLNVENAGNDDDKMSSLPLEHMQDDGEKHSPELKIQPDQKSEEEFDYEIMASEMAHGSSLKVVTGTMSPDITEGLPLKRKRGRPSLTELAFKHKKSPSTITSSVVSSSDRRRSCRKPKDPPPYQEAPESSIEESPELSQYPVTRRKAKCFDDDGNEEYCAICLDGGDEIICCDYCTKVFHLRCHIPPVDVVPMDEKWQCYYSKSREMIEESFLGYVNPEDSEHVPLVKSNEKQFALACKFVMECYQIPQIPTMRWRFPQGYLAAYGKVPFHLKYIRDRLVFGTPEPFSSIREMLLAFQQMIVQAFLYYKSTIYHKASISCYHNIVYLVEEYYPAYCDIFKNLNED